MTTTATNTVTTSSTTSVSSTASITSSSSITATASVTSSTSASPASSNKTLTELSIANGNNTIANQELLNTQSINATVNATIHTNETNIPIIAGAAGGLLAIIAVASIYVIRKRKDKVRKIKEIETTVNKIDLETHINVLFDRRSNKVNRHEYIRTDHSRVNELGISSHRFSMKPLPTVKMEVNPYMFAKPHVRPLSKPTLPDEIKHVKQVHTIKKVMLPVRPAMQKDFASYNVYNKRSSLRF